MTKTVTVVCCLALLLLHSIGISTKAAAQTPGWSSPPLTIAVFAPRDITKSLLDRVFAEAKAIWAPAGISLDWHRATAKDVVRTWQLEVTIDDGQKDLAAGLTALGWIRFTADGPEPSIYLSPANAEAYISGTPGVDDTSMPAHEALVGRALGRALAHELGHYLLKSKEHTPGGLMRAAWRADEFLALGRSGFKLTPQQREILRTPSKGYLEPVVPHRRQALTLRTNLRARAEARVTEVGNLWTRAAPTSDDLSVAT